MGAVKVGLAALSLVSCAAAVASPPLRTANVATVGRSYHVALFDSVAAAGANRVVVHVGGAPAVTAQGPAETLDKMEVVVERHGLQIQPRREFRDHFNWRALKPATFTVTVPRLTAASLAGSGDIRVDRAFGEHFAGSVAGSGTLEVAGLRTGTANFSVDGSGNLIARGKAGRVELSVAGSGNIHARGVSSLRGAVSIAGSGSAELSADETASVSIIGSGNADIAGRAHCTISRVGPGTVRCKS